MMTVFWDHQGPIFMEFLDWQHSIVNQYTYYDTLMNLRNAIKGKMMLSPHAASLFAAR